MKKKTSEYFAIVSTDNKVMGVCVPEDEVETITPEQLDSIWRQIEQEIEQKKPVNQIKCAKCHRVFISTDRNRTMCSECQKTDDGSTKEKQQ